MSNWILDKDHSEVEFRVKHMMISNIKGQFQEFDITLNVPNNDLTNASAEAVINTASVDTKNSQRDDHLRNADFFDSEKFPKITFKSTKFEKVDDEDYKLTGDLTIQDTTKSIVLNVEYGGIAADPWGNQKAGFSFNGKIKRSEFGLTWNAALETGGVMVSDEVRINGEIQFVVK
ncbi:MAG TPA: YceI family protein [Candidatus Sphingobacterium stercoripullorum]|uniref:YceI family protein n=1 Tax=Candidatus Sphingobacterium stercoripullorum TaxID=2838759 RepID=A0A9D1W9D2_9SPHI|nr:YceI family protein [Candidatus Sphingobacterium stercoripullorum]